MVNKLLCATFSGVFYREIWFLKHAQKPNVQIENARLSEAWNIWLVRLDPHMLEEISATTHDVQKKQLTSLLHLESLHDCYRTGEIVL